MDTSQKLVIVISKNRKQDSSPIDFIGYILILLLIFITIAVLLSISDMFYVY